MATTNSKVNNKVQNENAAKVNNKNFSAKEIFAKVAKLTEGKLNTSLGTKKATIFKEEIFAGCTEKEKKTIRRKLRNILLSFADSVTEKDTQLIAAFREFYLDTYQVNDYSLSSVCNENLHPDKKKKVQKLLEICKK